MIKRAFDILFSLLGLIVLSPVFILFFILIKLDSKGSVLYKQKRVGKGNKDFKLLKFRSMKVDSDKKGLLTIGEKDSRITRIGYYLRKHKMDEFPQLINVLKGDMSLVGPRPEVRKYVELYSKEQMKVLSIRPGITDIASIQYKNENELLKKSENPEVFYIKEVMPDKLRLNILYINDRSIFKDVKIIFKTLKAIIE
jgi:lipopolysaccharide/colanic/teichoic acid biosynthesis glycosyltransferase